jgi:hypothetical protein
MLIRAISVEAANCYDSVGRAQQLGALNPAISKIGMIMRILSFDETKAVSGGASAEVKCTRTTTETKNADGSSTTTTTTTCEAKIST